MAIEVELNQLDIRYKDFRCRNSRIEKNLLDSISRQGISEPLTVVEKKDVAISYILLDGFKRYHCAQKLSLHQIPVTIIGDTEVFGLLHILNQNQSSPLNALEEAVFIEELNSTYGLSYSEIGRRVNRSVSWVSLRAEMSRSINSIIREQILSGKFPLRSYLYNLAPFTRVKGGMEEVEAFVCALGGKGFSTRDISLLSEAFFGGEEVVKKQILEGNSDWTLRMLKTANEQSSIPLKKQTLQGHLITRLNHCSIQINEIIEKFLSAPELLSDKLLKEKSDRLGTSCYYYLDTIKELEI